MPIFFPDNPKRQERVVELGTDAQNFLLSATNDYLAFQELLDVVNPGIAEVYREAGLTPPSVSKHDILTEAGVADLSGADTAVEITDVIADIAGFIGTVKYLAPGATKALVRAGALTTEQAEKTLIKFGGSVLGRDIEITAGDVAGQVIGGVIGGIAIASIDLGIEAIEGKVAKDKLINGIHELFPARTSVRVSQLRAAELVSSLRAVKTTLDALTGSGVPLTDQLIRNIIKKDVQPSINAEQAITEASVLRKLAQFDDGRNSYTNDDPSS